MSEADRDEMNIPLTETFKSAFAANPDTKGRLKKERQANRTPKERHRGGEGPLRNVQVNVRQTQLTKKLIEGLSKKLDCSQADVIELAIAFFAAEHKIKG